MLHAQQQRQSAWYCSGELLGPDMQQWQILAANLDDYLHSCSGMHRCCKDSLNCMLYCLLVLIFYLTCSQSYSKDVCAVNRAARQCCRSKAHAYRFSVTICSYQGHFSAMRMTDTLSTAAALYMFIMHHSCYMYQATHLQAVHCSSSSPSYRHVASTCS